jgi:xylulokinase
MIAATGTNPLEVCTTSPTAATITAESTLCDAFEKMYRRYVAIYPAISAVTATS